MSDNEPTVPIPIEDLRAQREQRIAAEKQERLDRVQAATAAMKKFLLLGQAEFIHTFAENLGLQLSYDSRHPTDIGIDLEGSQLELQQTLGGIMQALVVSALSPESKIDVTYPTANTHPGETRIKLSKSEERSSLDQMLSFIGQDHKSLAQGISNRGNSATPILTKQLERDDRPFIGILTENWSPITAETDPGSLPITEPPRVKGMLFRHVRPSLPPDGTKILKMPPPPSGAK